MKPDDDFPEVYLTARKPIMLVCNILIGLFLVVGFGGMLLAKVYDNALIGSTCGGLCVIGLLSTGLWTRLKLDKVKKENNITRKDY